MNAKPDQQKHSGWKHEFVEGNGIDREVWISPDGKCYDELPDQQAEPPRRHTWDRDGERCTVCGAKDWMPGGCLEPPAETQSAVEWVQSKLIDDISGGTLALLDDDALELARRLERERDEARAELAKRSGDSHIDAPPTPCFFLKAILDASHAGCLNNCLHCGEVNELAAHEARDAAIDQHYAGYNAAVESPPPDGSAVEWVRELLYTADGRNRVLDEDDAIELARRCDAAQAELARLQHENTAQKEG